MRLVIWDAGLCAAAMFVAIWVAIVLLPPSAIAAACLPRSSATLDPLIVASSGGMVLGLGISALICPGRFHSRRPAIAVGGFVAMTIFHPGPDPAILFMSHGSAALRVTIHMMLPMVAGGIVGGLLLWTGLAFTRSGALNLRGKAPA